MTDLDPPTLQALLRGWGINPVHAVRVLREFYRNGATFQAICDGLPKALPGLLRGRLRARGSRVIARRVAGDGTVKLLVGMDDGRNVECVLMPSHRPDRVAGCISSQAGCAMGCDFCATGVGGLERNLASGEIVDQYVYLLDEARALNRRMTSLVFMGMGEPLANLPAVIPAIRRIADPDIGGLGWRQVTVSTVGIVPGMDQLANADLNIHLALSLHAADDDLRSRLVPVNRKYSIAAIMAAARRFQERTGRVVTIEWCLIDRINDTPEQADRLADLMDGFRAHVNLIAFNPIGAGVSGAVYRRPARERIERFRSLLIGRGVVCHLRQPRGDDVWAACGQLKGEAGQVPPYM